MVFAIHPNVYSTNNEMSGLLKMLEHIWIKTPEQDNEIGQGTFYIISGFSNYNGGVRFYSQIEKHIHSGGNCIAVLGGSSSQRLSSIQVVEQLLKIGCTVILINRKRLLHSKCYGFSSPSGDTLVISSGNFTGPGMSQNIEASLLLEKEQTELMDFSWKNLYTNLISQEWDYYRPDLTKREGSEWLLLYDEEQRGVQIIDDEQKTTLLITLSHSDTARIQASPRDIAGKGTQYFWLSKDSYDFFPALTILNERGYKKTYSAEIAINYIDLGVVGFERVTFEAENNLDFRLGTKALKYTKCANEGDLMALTRLSDYQYEMRFLPKKSSKHLELMPYANHKIGHKGKVYGYLPNSLFFSIYKK